MNPKVKELANQWCKGKWPSDEQFAVLTPGEAAYVAYLAGYNTNWELHVAVREGCAKLAGKEINGDS